MTVKLKSPTNELWKGWKLAWYHHFTHIACAKKLRGLRQKLDALREQKGQSLSKYHGFWREVICYMGTSFFIFHAVTDCFELNDPELKSPTNELWKGWKLPSYHHLTHIACAKEKRGLRQKLDALRVQNDNLFRCFRVSYINSSVTKGIPFLHM